VEGIATTWPSYQGPRLADEEDERMGLYSLPKRRKKMKTHILKALGELVTYTGRPTIIKYLKLPPKT